MAELLSDEMTDIRVVIRNGEYMMKDPRATAFSSLCIPVDRGWVFNGDYSSPTFRPSMNEMYGHPHQTSIQQMEREGPRFRNHYIITAGTVQYMGDCTHELAGQTAELHPYTRSELQYQIGLGATFPGSDRYFK